MSVLVEIWRVEVRVINGVQTVRIMMVRSCSGRKG